MSPLTYQLGVSLPTQSGVTAVVEGGPESQGGRALGQTPHLK